MLGWDIILLVPIFQEFHAMQLSVRGSYTQGGGTLTGLNSLYKQRLSKSLHQEEHM